MELLPWAAVPRLRVANSRMVVLSPISKRVASPPNLRSCGGVATTAGGVKLLRVFALYQHSAREMERLVYPSSIGGSGEAARQLRRRGAYVAWIFFMLFALSMAAVASAFALTGVPFEDTMVMTIAALSTTGPAAQVVLDHPLSYTILNDPGKYILMIAMALGRLETLALLALFNPQFWRR